MGWGMGDGLGDGLGDGGGGIDRGCMALMVDGGMSDLWTA
jgi:hypothetical protein